MTKLTDRTALQAATTNNDLIHMVDVSDTTQYPAGSSYKTTRAQFATQTFADAAARAAAVPGFIGQYGIQLDTGFPYRSTGVSAGNWTLLDPYSEWTDQAYSAGNFSQSGGGTWTVDSGGIVTNRYKIIGKTMFWHTFLGSTDISGTVSTLILTIPASQTLNQASMQSAYFQNNNTGAFLSLVAQCVGTTVTLSRVDGSAFDIVNDETDISFSLVFEIS